MPSAACASRVSPTPTAAVCIAVRRLIPTWASGMNCRNSSSDMVAVSSSAASSEASCSSTDFHEDKAGNPSHDSNACTEVTAAERRKPQLRGVVDTFHPSTGPPSALVDRPLEEEAVLG